MSEELKNAIELALKAGRATADEARRIRALLDNKETTKAERLLRTREVAAIWDCHTKSVLRYAARGLIKPVRRSRRCLRWKLSDVERIAQEGI